ncbi:MAG: hypothetical protein IT368_02975, partial [Candidatus Hydrogenedentes bacterium]|nr:hypothetical protein [Candidatus Hydrogenedentota bacterium]
MNHRPVPIRSCTVAVAVCLCAVAGFGAEYPPLTVEITPEHPLLIFQVSPQTTGDGGAYGQRVLDAWFNLPPIFRSYAVLQLTTPEREQDRRHANYRSLLQLCQDNEVPVVLDIADGDPRRYYPLEPLEELLLTYTCIKGVSATGLRFEEYDTFGAGTSLDVPPMVRWLMSAMDLAARYGRFIWIPLDELRWPRAMSSREAAPLYAKLRECAGYVLPGCQHRGPHNLGRMSAMVGLWLEGAVSNWGVEVDSRWYQDANFVEPGRFGTGPAAAMPSSILRAMILNGAMAGATVYAFAPDSALWFGRDARHWQSAIAPTLSEMIENGFIARKDFVQKKTPVALQLAAAATPEDFHLNLREIDPLWDRGLMVQGAYGMEAPGLVSELIINRSNGYWVPVVSAHAPAEVLQGFSQIVQPGMLPSSASWRELLDRQQGTAAPQNEAFVCEIGRAIFVMNTHENLRQVQRFALPEAPAPVRNIQALRQGETVEVTWPFREGDLSYKVLRRIPPSPNYEVLANGLYERRFVDEPPPSAPVAYVVTALTNEKEPYEGTVGYGE